VYALIFILRASHGRYLFPITPIILIFFVLFLRDGLRNTSFALKTLAVSALFTIGGYFFEINYILQKIILDAFLYSCFIFLIYTYHHRSSHKKVKQLLASTAFGFSTLFAAILFSVKYGQIKLYNSWGLNMECDKISQLIGNGNVWINDIGCGELIPFFRQDMGSNPEWNWKLASWIPKKYMLDSLDDTKTFTYYFKYLSSLDQYISQNNIDTIALVISTSQNKVFPMQDKLLFLQNSSLLKKRYYYRLKNKDLYVFDVIKQGDIIKSY